MLRFSKSFEGAFTATHAHICTRASLQESLWPPGEQNEIRNLQFGVKVNPKPDPKPLWDLMGEV